MCKRQVLNFIKAFVTMTEKLTIKRTNGADADFRSLITHLDNELWNELKEDQATYDQYNKVPDIETVLVLYADDEPVACGCFKKFDANTVEIKRMFVEKQYRRKGLSKRILEELESWAKELGFENAVLETSVHFETARTLYTNSGYKIIENYGQYKGLEESVCMKKKLNHQDEDIRPESIFKSLKDIEYFNFEENFVEKNVRCIPMIVRFKMDKAGIKLQLAEWSKFNVTERIELAKKACSNDEEAEEYNNYLTGLIKKHTGKDATALIVDTNPVWADTNTVPRFLNDRLKNFGWKLSPEQWKSQTNLQRFALLKLCKEGHENKNFPKAMKEFGLIS